MASALVGIGLGPLEIAIILLVVLLIFGPSKLPQLGAAIGKTLKGFKREMKSMEEDDKKDEQRKLDADKDRAAPAGGAGEDRRDEIEVEPKPKAADDKKKTAEA